MTATHKVIVVVAANGSFAPIAQNAPVFAADDKGERKSRARFAFRPAGTALPLRSTCFPLLARIYIAESLVGVAERVGVTNELPVGADEQLVFTDVEPGDANEWLVGADELLVGTDTVLVGTDESCVGTDGKEWFMRDCAAQGHNG